MKKLIYFILTNLLFSATLINVNFFQTDNKIDVLLSLDEKFNGKIIKESENEYIITNINSTQTYKKEFQNFFIKKIEVIPLQKKIKLKIDASDFRIIPALTPDKYGLRFRIAPIKKEDSIKYLQATTQKESFNYISYTIMLLSLIAIAIILWYIRKKTSLPLKSKSSMKVIMQKQIDAKNKVVLFEFGAKKYLLLIGNSNLLIDVFSEDIKTPKTKVEFDEMLKLHSKDEEIEKYLKNAEKLKDLNEKV